MRNHKEVNRLQEQSGESCDEGGPFPSHKIPQRKEFKLKRSKETFIHLSKEMIHYNGALLLSAQKNVSPAVSNSPSNDDVSSF